MAKASLQAEKKRLGVEDSSAIYQVAAVSSPQVPAGYKQTEVGVIPLDWDVRSLRNELDRLEAGVSVSSVDEAQRLYPHDQSILKTSSVANGQFLSHEAKKIAPRDILRAQLNPRADTIIISRMNTPDLVGECGYVGENYPDLFLPDRLWMTRARQGSETCIRWLAYLLTSEQYKRRLKGAATGTSGSMKNLSKEAFLSISIPFPESPEQRAIAAALSDVDALLAKLDALIAKKRDLKQAAMQQLLTGQTRLPGFGGEWEVKPFGDVLRVRHGKSQHSVAAADGMYPILATGGEIGRTNTPLYDKPSVLIGRKGTIDKPQYRADPFWTVDTLFYTEILGQASAKFVFYKFCMIDWRSYNEASGVPSLNASTIESIEACFPPSDEQTAIATLLTDMDAEIAALEACRDKTRALKQGMMQALLTGRIRLI